MTATRPFLATALASLLALAALTATQRPARGTIAPPAEVPPPVQFVGHDSKITTQRFELVKSEAAWTSLWAQHSGRAESFSPPERHSAPKIDFERFMVIAAFNGSSTNTDALIAESVSADENAVRVRFDRASFQTSGPDGGAMNTTAFGFWVVERSDRPVILEQPAPRSKGQNIRWTEVKRLNP